MADRVLCITWDRASHGREERGLEVFDEAVGILGRMQQDGRIEKFDVALFNPNRELGGCIMIQGSAEQIAALHEDPEFQREAVAAYQELEGGAEGEVRALWRWITEVSLRGFDATYRRLGIRHDLVSGESFYEPLLELVGARLLAAGGIAVAEHFHKRQLPERIGALLRTRQKRIGDHCLSFYARAAEGAAE